MTPDATEPADGAESEAAPPRDSRGRSTPRADDATPRRRTLAEADAAPREAADAEADVPPGAPPPDAAPMAAAPEEHLPQVAPPQAVVASGVADRLRSYATRLAEVDEGPVATAVADYAARIEGVASGELPPSASANPSALTPPLVGEALERETFTRWPFTRTLELVRNVLIFTPVLWTWIKFGEASGGYGDYVDPLPAGTENTFLVWWLDNGLGETVIWAVVLLMSIILATAALGFVRGRVEQERSRAASEFAALLAEAESVGARQRADDPQEAIAAFASAGRDLTAELRAGGDSLAASVRPLADSVRVAQGVMENMSGAIERQQEQSEAIASSLGRVSDVADRLAAIEASFAEASGAAKQGAEALEGIRSSLDPQAGEIARAAAGLDGLATAIGDAAARLGRATEEHGELLAAQAEGAERYREAATTMREVADAVGGVSEVAGRLGALETTFGEMRDAARTNAEALDGVRASLEPQAERYSAAAERIAGMAESIERAVAQIARATEDYGKSLAGFADGAEQLGEAARTMNAVAIRLRDDMAASP